MHFQLAYSTADIELVKDRDERGIKITHLAAISISFHGPCGAARSGVYVPQTCDAGGFHTRCCGCLMTYHFALVLCDTIHLQLGFWGLELLLEKG